MKRQGNIRCLGLLCCLLGWGLACADTPSSNGELAAVGDNPEALATVIAPVPVRFRAGTLFTIAAPLGALSPTERARAVESRLLAIADGPATVLQSLRVTERADLTELYAGETLIRAISDEDAQPTGRTRQQLAADELLVVRNALRVEFKDRGAAHIARATIICVAATVLLAGILFGLHRLHRWVNVRIHRTMQTWHLKSGLARLRLLPPGSVANTTRSFATLLAASLSVLLAYFYLEFVLSQFPWTRGLADQMVSAAKHAVVRVFSSLFNYVPSLLNIVVIVIVARYFLKLLKALFVQIELGNITFAKFHADWATPTFSLVRFTVIAISAVMIFPYLPGSGSAGFKGIAAFLGLALSFGGAPAIGNIIAGIIITYMRPFIVGDRVKIADAVGDIVAKTLLVVRLRTIKNVEISIPNALVLANHIINFSANAKDPGLILHTTVTIGYDAPWKRVHELLIIAAGRVAGLKTEPAPFVLQTSLDDFYVAYELNVYTDRPNEQTTLYARLHEEIQNAFNEGGVEILSPHYTSVRDGNATAVPNEYLPEDYQAPRFTILSRFLRPGEDS